jgi:sulfate/thiosulfate transport system ATP-binding protein
MSVVVRGVTKSFTTAGTPAVADVSFEAPKGGITALLGPSGAGKSTVLRLIAGLEVADQGTIAIDDEDVSRLPVQKRGIGLVFQNYALFEHMTVRKNIGFGLEVRKTARADIDARVSELLELIQLVKLGERLPAELSGGQRQRVAFARALAVRPRVLLLDEPFGALDARVRQELREWLHEVHQQTGVTTLLVTHDQNEALELAAHVVVMLDGRVAQAGSPSELYDHPASPGVAAFIGGVNVLRGRVDGGRAQLGTVEVSAPDGAAEGESVHAYVRPQDIRLASATQSSEVDGVSLAMIERLRRVGGSVKVSLVLADGEKVTMETPKADIDALGVSEGDHVLVDLRAAKVFLGGYSI